MAKNGLCEESARGNWDRREDHQPFRPNPSGVENRTITLRELLIGADELKHDDDLSSSSFGITIFRIQAQFRARKKDLSCYSSSL